MEITPNGTTTEGAIVMTTAEMDHPLSDDQQLVADGVHSPDAGQDEGSHGLGAGFGKKGCNRPTGGLAILISATLVFSLAVTVALIIQIYAGPYVGEYGGVAADVPQCSQLGVDILAKGGSAVDAAIASLFCVSVINAHNSGIGGGGFMLIYDHKTNTHLTRAIDFRETAPSSAYPDMFKDDKDGSRKGPRSVGVPGQLRGMEMAHNLYGRLPWKDLVIPSVEIARNGFNVTKRNRLHKIQTTRRKRFSNDLMLIVFADNVLFYISVLALTKVSIDDFKGPLRDIYVRNGQFVGLGDQIVQPKLELYGEGSNLAMDRELLDCHSITTCLCPADGNPCRALMWAFAQLTIRAFWPCQPPGGGPTLMMMLNIMEGFNWTAADKNSSLMYHRMIETFRFAYAQRPLLADPDFSSSVDNSSMYMIMKETAAEMRKKIMTYNGTKPLEFYLPPSYKKSSGGTTHLSAADSNELYVSVTASTNYWFGARLMTSTGIQLNNHMDDFDTPGVTNKMGLPPNTLNLPKAGKRPLSAMTPTVVYTIKKPCALRMAVGASNGTRIISGVAETLVNLLSFGMTLEEAISRPRVHDQLFENETDYEEGLPEEVVKYLRGQGYNLVKVTEGLNCVQAVMKNNDTTDAQSDGRKWGRAAVLQNTQ
ncbi:glutathione hydrolase 1 proenzyme-like [Liolophura sinensis]|uniref:glutathione hydrolase 1 proenzyme-like n=1 Tax=Liolophura sinensis TaxID=3198878 RepID=UPI0031584D0D